jgi:hypothetical protein
MAKDFVAVEKRNLTPVQYSDQSDVRPKTRFPEHDTASLVSPLDFCAE